MEHTLEEMVKEKPRFPSIISSGLGLALGFVAAHYEKQTGLYAREVIMLLSTVSVGASTLYAAHFAHFPPLTKNLNKQLFLFNGSAALAVASYYFQ